MATTPKTILEHTDDKLALKRGTWIVTTAEIMGTPWPDGGQNVLPKGMRLRVEQRGMGDYLSVHAENAEKFQIRRNQLANVEVAPVLRKFKVRVSQMVEQLGEFEIEAEDADAAYEKASDMDLFCAVGEGNWRTGENADKASIYEIENEAGEPALYS